MNLCGIAYGSGDPIERHNQFPKAATMKNATAQIRTDTSISPKLTDPKTHEPNETKSMISVPIVKSENSPSRNFTGGPLA